MGTTPLRFTGKSLANTKFKRIFWGLLAIGAAAVVLIILFISPIAKFLIERYDEKYTGRQITLDWAYVNPFTGFVHLHNVKIREAQKDTVFFSARGVSADFELWKLFSKKYEITELTLDRPRGTVVQKKKLFNFDDLVQRFSSDSLAPPKPPLQLNILNVKILHGEFYYNETVIPIHYWIRELNLESPGKRWNADTIAAHFSFLAPDGKGSIAGDFLINVRNSDYHLSTSLQNFDLEIVRQYLWELINYGMFSAHLDARVKAFGNFKNPDNIDLKGRLSFRDFRLGKTKKDNYASFEKLVLVIDELSPMHQKFLFDSVILARPFFKYEKYDSLDNIERLFGKNGSNISEVTSQSGRFNLIIEIGRYLKKIARNFFESHYRINRLRVSGADFMYSDYSLGEKFTINTQALTLRADSVDRRNKRTNFYTTSLLKPYGDVAITLSINPKDSGDFDMVYHVNKVPVSLFNPYLISYTSFPLDHGTLDLNGVWNVRGGNIHSVNHVLVIDPRVSRRLRNKNNKWIPLPLIMAFVRERSSVIDYQIPISGNLKNPHFHLHQVVMDVIKNIFIKPVTIPYGVSVKNAEKEIENTLSLRWDRRQYLLKPSQKRFLGKLVKFMESNPDQSVTVVPMEYGAKEREYILFFLAKKKYFLLVNHRSPGSFSADDSIAVDRMSVKNTAFMRALRVGYGKGDTISFTIQDKCLRFVGAGALDAQYAHLVKHREGEFKSFFKDEVLRKKVIFRPSVDTVPYNGFSFFKIVFKGEIPKSLQRAYDEMHELNEEGPRKKYFDGKEPVADRDSKL
jgi:hypothetical protein